MTDESLKATKENLTDEGTLVAALTPMAAKFATSDNPRALYELLSQVNPHFRNNNWQLVHVQAIIGMAKQEGLISQGASDEYGWWLREAWESLDEAGRREVPIRDAVVNTCGEEITFRGLQTDEVVRDMQVIWGIPDGMTFAQNSEQAQTEHRQYLADPGGPVRVTPVLEAGYNSFFRQNMNEAGADGSW